MDENSNSCKCKLDYSNVSIIGGIIAYELGVVILLLVFILWSLSEQPRKDLEQSTEEIDRISESRPSS